MKNARVLFISHEITPYLEVTPMSKLVRALPQGIQERGKEIRTFMPRFGVINERRNQLHEVIRLSGMNLIIDDNDYQLIIKVASIQSARMQVYFIDNEDLFHRKSVFGDSKNKFFDDNDLRSVFFCRGVLETVKKLGWSPDIIHCHGWMSSLVPLFVKTSYKDEPIFKNSKVVFSAYNDFIDEELGKKLQSRIKMEGIEDAELKAYKTASTLGLNLGAIEMADAVIRGHEHLHADLEKALKNTKKPVLDYQNEETYIDAYNDFYDSLLVDEKIIA